MLVEDCTVANVAGRAVLDQHKPVIYQEAGSKRLEVVGGYALKGEHEVGFEVGEYDPAKPLIIDPVLSYSTFLGGTGSDE